MRLNALLPCDIVNASSELLPSLCMPWPTGNVDEAFSRSGIKVSRIGGMGSLPPSSRWGEEVAEEVSYSLPLFFTSPWCPRATPLAPATPGRKYSIISRELYSFDETFSTGVTTSITSYKLPGGTRVHRSIASIGTRTCTLASAATPTASRTAGATT